MTDRRKKAPKTAERLGRMLVIVPYLVKHPGTSLPEAATLFGVEPVELRRDLDLLFMSGLPPYGPGDLIDVDVDEDDRIWISMADHFARPLRLTRQEALAVYLRGAELLATPGVPDAPALASALEKLRDSLGSEALEGAEGIETATDGSPPSFLASMREAARTHERLHLEYLAASTGELTSRTVEPEEVFASLGHWYTAAWDVDADAERLFRVDRIRSAERTGDRFDPRGLEGAGRALYTPTADDVAVRLRLRPPARWVAEYYATTDPEELDDGSVEVTLPARQLTWLARLLLRLGDGADVVAPPELLAELKDQARRTLTVYGS
jgi:proteasome accessory factor C